MNEWIGALGLLAILLGLFLLVSQTLRKRKKTSDILLLFAMTLVLGVIGGPLAFITYAWLMDRLAKKHTPTSSSSP